MKNKICKTCNTEKPLSHFIKCGWFRNKQRYRLDCKNCYRIVDRTFYKQDRSKRYRERNPNKDLAHKILKESVRKGILIKPESCSKCLKIFPNNLIHGHHCDYTKPLEVMWLCHQCHKDVHRLMRLPHTAI